MASSVKDKIIAVAKSPVMRPVEIWAVRALLAYLAVKLGVDVGSLVH